LQKKCRLVWVVFREFSIRGLIWIEAIWLKLPQNATGDVKR